MSNIPVLVYIQ